MAPNTSIIMAWMGIGSEHEQHSSEGEKVEDRHHHADKAESDGEEGWLCKRFPW